MKKLAHIIHKNRIAVMVGCWLIAIGMGLFIPRMEIDPEVEAMVPSNMPSRLATDSIENLFGGTDNILVLFESRDILNAESLKRIKSIEKELKKIPEIETSLSLFSSKSIKGEDGMMIVDPAIRRIPKSEKQIEKLRKDLISNEMVYEVIISPDFRFTSIILGLQKEVENEAVLTKIEKVLADNPGDEKVYLGGIPVVSRAITTDITNDLAFLLPLALLLMIAILWISFRSFNGVYLPFSIVIMAILVSMGMMPILGWKMAIVSVLLPVMLIAIANNYGIHIYNRHLELERENGNGTTGGDKILAIWKVLAKPVILTGITTIAGILGLLSHIIIPAKQVGVLAAIGILWALIMSLIYIPAFLSGAKIKIKKTNPKVNVLEKALRYIANQLVKHPVEILAGTLMLIVFLAFGILRLQVEGDIVKFFKKDHIVRQSSELIDDHMGGSQTISIHYTGDIKDPDLLRRMMTVEEELDGFKGVGQVMSIASVVKIMSKSILDPGDPEYNKIPSTREAVAQYFELYSFSGDPADFEQLVDFNYENAQLIIRINDASSTQVLKLRNKINNLTEDDPAVVQVGGMGLINAELVDQLVRGQNRSLVFALVVVCLLIILIFRSWKAGALSLAPLLSACIVLFGSMGWLGIKLDAATVLLSSVMIGVGVDYTIHYLWRHKQELAAGKTVSEAVVTTLTTTGKGITFNAITVIIGFSALLFSSFNAIQFFGFLTSVSIFTCLVGALIIIPALLVISQPEYFKGKRILKIKIKRNGKKAPHLRPPAYSGAADGSKQ